MSDKQATRSGGWRRWFPLFSGSATKPATRSRPGARPTLEQLEGRQLLTAGSAAIAQALTHSAEYYGNVVTGIYEHYLNRAPDAQGLTFWVGQMQAGLSDERLEAGFLGSPEYIRNHGSSNDGWVRGMYSDLLGRSADAAGLDFWARYLDEGADPGDVAYGFAASREREAQRVSLDYDRYLGRSPDQTGLDFWTDQFMRGYSNEDLVAGFVGSDEYYNDMSGGVARWFLDSAYHQTLNRYPTDAEVQSWASAVPDVFSTTGTTTPAPSETTFANPASSSGSHGSSSSSSHNTGATAPGIWSNPDSWDDPSLDEQLLAVLQWAGNNEPQYTGLGDIVGGWINTEPSLQDIINIANGGGSSGGGNLGSWNDTWNWLQSWYSPYQLY